MSQEIKLKTPKTSLEEVSKLKPTVATLKIEPNAKKFSWLIWLLAGVVLLLAIFGWQYYQFNQKIITRRNVAKLQQEKMTKFWQDQGLSQSEIDLKLKADRQQNFRPNGAIVVTLVGGLVGIIIGIGVTYVAATLISVPFMISLWSVALALGVSASVGILFGWYPANQAARLQPIDALRYE